MTETDPRFIPRWTLPPPDAPVPPPPPAPVALTDESRPADRKVMAVPTPPRWWPALDGLRGLAVLAVLLYHLDESLVPGGFLGVSLFFTISGFLIVGQLAVERDRTGGVDLRRFWTRRLRRLAPAFSVTVVATVVAVAVREPASVDRVAGDALAGVAYVANWRDLFAEVEYADRFATGVEPLAHLWSLSIEEQVYLLVPLVVAWWGLRRAGWLAVAAVAVGVVVWWGSSDAYFATPVRLGEVAAGAVLGVRVMRGADAPRWLTAAAWPALALAVVSVTVVADTEPLLFRAGFPTIALLWLPLVAAAVGTGTFARILSFPALRWVGTRSYAIYLFHVPLIELTDWSAAQVVAVTLLAAEVSHRVVETPIRRGTLRLPALAGVSLAAAVVVAGVGLGAGPASTDVRAAVAAALPATDRAVEAPSSEASSSAATPSRPSSAASWSAPSPGPAPIPDVTPMPAPTDVTTTTVAAPLPTGVRVMTVGDSTAVAVGSALEAFLAFHGSTLADRAIDGCSPLFSEEQEWSLRFTEEPDGYVAPGHCRASIAAQLGEVGEIDVVVMFDHGMAMADHRRVGSEVWLSLADDELADALHDRYLRWADEAAAAGATLVLATAPAPVPGTVPATTMGDSGPDRIAAYNDIVQRVADHSPDTVVVVDLAAPVIDDPERYLRSDGVHYDAATGAVHVVVDHLGPAALLASK